MNTLCEVKVYEVVELFMKNGEEVYSMDWTTRNEKDFTYLPYYENAKLNEDCFYREGSLVTIYRYEK